MGDAVLLDLANGIATITLNQPDRRNPFSESIKAGIKDALDEIDGDARCLVFEGAGPAFSAGGDIDAMRERFAADVSPNDRVKELGPIHNMMVRIADYPAPTVAKVDGACVGAGVALMLACDVQLASDRSKFGIVFRHVGLSIDAGTSYFLPRVVGTNVAKELAFTGEIFGADRAGDLDLVNHVYPADEFDDRADELIAEIATGPTVALQYSKTLIDSGITKGLEEAMRDEAVAGGIVYATDDHREGVEAFVEDRDPSFTGR